MAKGDNPCIPYFDGADDVTCEAEAAVTGCRFISVSDPQDGPAGMGLDTSASGGRIRVSHAAAGTRALGVASYDAGIGEGVGCIRGNKIVPVEAGAAITAGQAVEVGANGTAIPLAAGLAVGIACDDIANGAKGPIALL